ncbi:MAG: hypothetical protein QM769_02215 [Pseudoxanthomonas sp.]
MAGALMVLAFFGCGLTQSIFAHQLAASCCAMLVGSLQAFAQLETPDSLKAQLRIRRFRNQNETADE